MGLVFLVNNILLFLLCIIIKSKSELLFFIVQAAYTVLTSSGSVPEAIAFAADLIAASL